MQVAMQQRHGALGLWHHSGGEPGPVGPVWAPRREPPAGPLEAGDNLSDHFFPAYKFVYHVCLIDLRPLSHTLTPLGVCAAKHDSPSEQPSSTLVVLSQPALPPKATCWSACCHCRPAYPADRTQHRRKVLLLLRDVCCWGTQGGGRLLHGRVMPQPMPNAVLRTEVFGSARHTYLPHTSRVWQTAAGQQQLRQCVCVQDARWAVRQRGPCFLQTRRSAEAQLLTHLAHDACRVRRPTSTGMQHRYMQPLAHEPGLSCAHGHCCVGPERLLKVRGV